MADSFKRLYGGRDRHTIDLRVDACKLKGSSQAVLSYRLASTTLSFE
jgi:hypothetical protein